MPESAFSEPNLVELKRKIDLLIDSHQRISSERDVLKMELSRIVARSTEPVAKDLSLAQESKNAMLRLKIDELVREIDICLTGLKKEEIEPAG